MIEFGVAQDMQDFEQIIALQKANMEAVISASESKEQGFLTVKHNIDLLAAMNEPFPHIIARDQNKIIGYALVMGQEMKNRIPILIPLFRKISELSFNNQAIQDSRYFVMGQVCIEKNYRGKGIFSDLYQKMKEQMSDHFDFVVTEVATRNTRSVSAHQKVGFKDLLTYKHGQEEWSIIIWNWS